MLLFNNELKVKESRLNFTRIKDLSEFHERGHRIHQFEDWNEIWTFKSYFFYKYRKSFVLWFFKINLRLFDKKYLRMFVWLCTLVLWECELWFGVTYVLVTSVFLTPVCNSSIKRLSYLDDLFFSELFNNNNKNPVSQFIWTLFEPSFQRVFFPGLFLIYVNVDIFIIYVKYVPLSWNIFDLLGIRICCCFSSQYVLRNLVYSSV